MRQTIITVLLALAVLGLRASSEYDYIRPAAPFEMPAIASYQFPERDFTITDFGATLTGSDEERTRANTAALARAMAACNEAGGGRVVVPAGEWLTGPVHFKSRCCLYLTAGATLRFTDRQDCYLPAVPTSWEGLECMNYSPLLYAYRCYDVAIAGEGTLRPDLGTWSKWYARPKTHIEALKQLYDWGYKGTPIEQRQAAQTGWQLRPHLIQFNQCRGIRLEGFNIKGSPFWTIHLYRSQDALVRRLNVYAHGHNNDGIDIEMTRVVLIEDCTFDQGDDAVVLKAGRNHDAWRIGQPTENVVVRRCTVKNGHVLLGCGSEISGGIRNVYMTQCRLTQMTKNLMYLKTNRRRGAFIEGIYMDHIDAGEVRRVFAIDTDILYQWKDIVPTYKDSLTLIRDIHLSDVRCRKADGIVEINGDKDLPPHDIYIDRVKVDTINIYAVRATNVKNFRNSDITYDTFLGKKEAERWPALFD